jgi:hypothetical protein
LIEHGALLAGGRLDPFLASRRLPAHHAIAPSSADQRYGTRSRV